MTTLPTMRILRSSTGKYHLGANSASWCNGRSGKFSLASDSDVESAKDGSFCKFCFGPNPKQFIKYEL